MTRLRQQASCLRSVGAIPMPLPVLTPVRDVVSADFYLNATQAEWDAYIDAQDYGDDDE
jgi:hypothetical protein